jgi:DNA-binding NarL/FixJ family response regulator
MGLYNPTVSPAPSARRTRVIVADPFPVILLGLRRMVEDDPRLHVIAEASTMPLVWKNVLEEQPEVVLLDWKTASQNLDMTRALLQSESHPSSIIFLTVSEDSQQKQHMLRLGASGFLSKACSGEELRAAVFQASTVPKRGPIAVAMAPPIADAARRIRQLTKRERQLLPLVCNGLKNKEIAAELRISESTVWHHLTAIFTKLQVDDRLGLAAFAYTHGLVHSGVQSLQDAV